MSTAMSVCDIYVHIETAMRASVNGKEPRLTAVWRPIRPKFTLIDPDRPQESSMALLGVASIHISHWSQGKGSQGFPIKTIRDDKGLLGPISPYWAALAPLV